jgi:hypothetical protein
MRRAKLRRFEYAVTICAVGLAAAAVACRRPDLRVALTDISGFTDSAPVSWMPFRFTLSIRNAGRGPVTIQRIHITPDLDDFNEAYNLEHPADLASPIRLDAGSTTTYRTSLTLLNAVQLSERRHRLVFKVRLETSDGDLEFDFPTEFEQSRDPKKRTLQRLPEL